MLGQNTLFEEELSGLSRDKQLDTLAQLITSPAGKSKSLSLYMQENWSNEISLLAKEMPEKDLYKFINEVKKGKDKDILFAYDKSQRPLTLISKEKTETKYGDTLKIVDLLKKNDFVAYESQLRCSFKKPEFVNVFGDEYKKPLADYLNGRYYNEDCDGITSITIDFDSNADKDMIENCYTFTNNKEINIKRSYAKYALDINSYALLFKQQLPKELEPTSIRFTGRGFQFIYQLSDPFYFNKDRKENSKDQEKFVRDTIMWLRRSLDIEHQTFYDDLGKTILPKNCVFTLDKAFENNLSQMRRIPGSYNDKSGMYAAYIYLSNDLINDKHYLQDLIDFCKENYRELYWLNNKTIRYFNKSSLSYTPIESLHFAKTRLQALATIVNERYKTNTLIGSRHNFITQITNAIADVKKHETGKEPSYNDIFNTLITFHVEHFKNQRLTVNEVKSAAKAVMKRREKILLRGDSTNLSHSSIVFFLDLTEEEEGILSGVGKTSKRRVVSITNRLTRAEKAVQAHALYQEGYSYEKIAEALDVSKSTAHRYVNTLYNTVLKENKAELKAEELRLKEQLRTTQRELYLAVYERMTRMIIARKVKIRITEPLNKKGYGNEHLKIILGFISKAIQESVGNYLRFNEFDKMMLIRKKVNTLVNKIMDSGSFKHMVNEYVLISYIADEFESDDIVRKYLFRVDDKLEKLIIHLIKIYILKEDSTIKRFYPEGRLARYYYFWKNELPFKLLETDPLIRYRYGVSKEEYQRIITENKIFQKRKIFHKSN